MKRHKLSEYLKAYENGTLSYPDKLDFYRMVADPSNKDIVDEWLAEHWGVAHPLGMLPPEQSEELYRNIIESSNPPAAKRVAKRHRFLWTAAASIVIILTAGLFLINKYRAGNQENIIENNLALNQDVQSPKSNHATIKSSTGEILYLDKSANGEIMTQEGVTLEKKGEGQIEYSRTSANSLLSNITNTLTNPAGSQSISVEMSDGTRILLNSGSSLTYPVIFSGSERRVELYGEAYFEVEKDEKAPFIVSVGGRSAIKVLGTEFNVKCFDNEPADLITLVNGSVLVFAGNDSKSGSSYKLSPGEQAILANDGVVSIAKVDIQEYIAWRENIFYFNDTRLESIANSLMRWYGVQIKFQEENLKNAAFHAIISRKNNISTILDMIKMTGKIDYEMSDNEIIIKRTN